MISNLFITYDIYGTVKKFRTNTKSTLKNAVKLNCTFCVPEAYFL